MVSELRALQQPGAVQREAASSQTGSFIFSLACHAALAGGCLRLRALRMRMRCQLSVHRGYLSAWPCAVLAVRWRCKAPHRHVMIR
eukprot:scaffold2646_cov103-Isochrysis_galbana.AAC.9